MIWKYISGCLHITISYIAQKAYYHNHFEKPVKYLPKPISDHAHIRPLPISDDTF